MKEPPPEAPARATASFSDAARKAMPAVVNIFTSKEVKRPRHPFMDDPLFRYFFGEQPDLGPQRREGLGSGVIVSEQGYILTNHHVVESVDQIEVALADSRKVPARVVGTDPETDLAVLKIELQKLPAITFGRPEQLRVGDVVLAIGNPFGVGQTVTHGHRQRARPQPSRHHHLRELHPDRRRDQPRQFRRRAGGRERQPGRHQHRDLLADRGLAWASASPSRSASPGR